MNKSELIDVVAANSGLTKADAAKAVDGFTKAVTDTLAKGQEVAILGFGTYKVSERAERQGRNPATGEALTIAAAKVPTFKAGKALKDALN
ncbi:HU family DNA-binding protein [Neisseriaceae bacterium CLB008]